MRNESFIRAAINGAAGLLLAIAVTGCNVDQAKPEDNPQLAAGYRALDQQQYDVAIENADQYLRTHMSGPGSAEALYLKGRGFEQKTASDPAESKRNLFEARTAYSDALAQHPSQQTEGYIRASLSNVAFFEEDYPAALSEASRAYPLVGPPAIQSVLLYRMGLSEQRMGRFTDADQTFELVQERYGSMPIARSAQEHVGLRNFYVRLATFNTAAGADRAIASLQGSHVLISKHLDASGHTIVESGPYASYDAAKDVKARFAQQYADALIIP